MDTPHEVVSLRLNWIDPETKDLKASVIETQPTLEQAAYRANLYQRFWANSPQAQQIPVIFFSRPLHRPIQKEQA